MMSISPLAVVAAVTTYPSVYATALGHDSMSTPTVASIPTFARGAVAIDYVSRWAPKAK